MSNPTSAFPPARRRAFLGQLATTAVALAGTAFASTGTAIAATSPGGGTAAPTPSRQDDSWTARITGKHKAVFDAPEVADGLVITNVWVFLKGFRDTRGLTDADLSAVAVIRHAAIPLAFDDAIWEKYGLGKRSKVKEPCTKAWARRNRFARAAADDQASAPFTLGALNDRGVILIGCALATQRMAGEIATQTKQRPDVVHDELRAHLIPGLQLAPSGIYAVTLAQEAGCSYVRST